jgi:cytochrome c peroxidase
MRTNYPCLLLAAALAVLSSCAKGPEEESGGETPDPAEVQLGERLFLETRFAQFFAVNSGGDPNAVLALGDPVMDLSEGVTEDLRGPFKGKSMNCRACHLVDEQGSSPGGGVRTYDDFARRSPIPDRGDGKTHTPRNSPPLVNSSIDRGATPAFFHFDGEFATLEDLVRGTFSGRNFGWLPAEQAQAIAHVASIIRGDDGQGDLAQQFGGLSYAVVLVGVNPSIPSQLVIPPAFRIDVAGATDQQIFDAVAKLVAAYVDSLRFAQNSQGDFTGSPFDAFLAKNGLPRQPDATLGESDLDYARRLRTLLGALATPVWVTPADGALALHAQDFVFGQKEFDGLKIFLSEPALPVASPSEIASGRVGNCVVCHAPPKFTDFKFHNVGVAQSEFDGIFGSGAFMALAVPSFSTRTASDLPASAANPTGQGPFLSIPSSSSPGKTDLGLWNVFGNPAVPGPQAALQTLFGAPSNATLDQTIALFKTPTLRDLGQSAPYFHTGEKDSFEDVLLHYLAFSALGRAGNVRNGAPELQGIAILAADLDALRAFLRSLNEDYQ